MSVAQNYAAVLKSLDNSDSVEKVINRMKEKGHMSLLPEVVRILEREEDNESTFVTLSKNSDKRNLDNVIKEVGGEVNNIKVKIDPNIVDGYIVRKKGKLVDASVRKSLVTIYQKAIGQ